MVLKPIVLGSCEYKKLTDLVMFLIEVNSCIEYHTDSIIIINREYFIKRTTPNNILITDTPKD